MNLDIGSIQALGTSEFILPAHMCALQQDEIDEIRKNGERNRIIACGYDKKIHSFILIDDLGAISEVDVARFFNHFIIIDDAMPIEKGSKIEVSTPIAIIQIDSPELLSASKPVDMSDFEIDMKS